MPLGGVPVVSGLDQKTFFGHIFQLGGSGVSVDAQEILDILIGYPAGLLA